MILRQVFSELEVVLERAGFYPGDFEISCKSEAIRVYYQDSKTFSVYEVVVNIKVVSQFDSINNRVITFKATSLQKVWSKIQYELDYWIDSVLKNSQHAESNVFKKVFVIHGRDERVTRDIINFLRSIGLEPFNYETIINSMQEVAPYTGEVLDIAFRTKSVFLMLFTPDDLVSLSEELRRDSDSEFDKLIMGQARPNVYFEAGIAFGKSPERTLMVKIKSPKPFSDVAGKYQMKLDNSPGSRRTLIRLLDKLGCKTNTSENHWMEVGDFS